MIKCSLDGRKVVAVDSALSFGVDQNERCCFVRNKGLRWCRAFPRPPQTAPGPCPRSPRPPQDEDYEILLWSRMKDFFLIGSAYFRKKDRILPREVSASGSKSVKGHNSRIEKPIVITNTQEPVNPFQVANHTPWNLTPYKPHTIFGLPPDLKTVWSKCRDHIFNEMTVRVQGFMIRIL